MVVGRGGNRKAENYRTSTNSSAHAESSWRLEEFAEGPVTMGNPFLHFTTRVVKGDFLRRRRLGPCITSKG